MLMKSIYKLRDAREMSKVCDEQENCYRWMDSYIYGQRYPSYCLWSFLGTISFYGASGLGIPKKSLKQFS